MTDRFRDLRFPIAGVVRRMAHQDRGEQKPYPTPWAVNVRAEDPISGRLRGGSRPGLTKFVADAVGTSIGGIVALDQVTAAGTAPQLAMIVDETLGVHEGGAVSFPAAVMLTQAGDEMLTQAEDEMLLGTGAVPASGFLAVRNERVYAITPAGVVSINAATGEASVLEATKGTVPTGCTFGCVYRDRLFLAGEDNAIYAPRQGDVTDWDYGADVEDAGRALAFQLSGGGELGPLPTALVPHEDSYLLAASLHTLWVVQGDPAAGGAMRNVSRNVGIVGPSAWCKVDGAVAFLATDGLYLVGADGSGLQSLSGDRIPEELLDIDASEVAVSLVHDHRRDGVCLFLTPAASGGTHWFFHFPTKSFWAMRFQDNHEPVAACRSGDDVVLACADGYLRVVGGDDDDGEPIESHVLIGPIQAASSIATSVLTEIQGVLDQASDGVTWRVVTGDTAEKAVTAAKTAIETYQSGDTATAEAIASYRGTLVAGRTRVSHPRVRAPWMVFWLQSTGKWAYENLTIGLTKAGRWR